MLGMWWELEKIFNAQGVKIGEEAFKDLPELC